MVAINHLYQSEDNYQTGIRVEHALIRTFPDRFLHVAASAFYGIVELTGSVASLHDKSLAIQLAERVPGVTTVVESLRVEDTSPLANASRRLAAGLGAHPKQLASQHNSRLRWSHD